MEEAITNQDGPRQESDGNFHLLDSGMNQLDVNGNNNANNCTNIHKQHFHKTGDTLQVMPEEEFRQQVQYSIANHAPLEFFGYQVELTGKAIRLKGRDHLVIHGGCIQGAIHSLFQIDGDKKHHPRQLSLKDVTLLHTKEHEDPREIGAAVFAMGTCRVELEHCYISSKGGFAVWAKHQCQVRVSSCTIQNVARTAVACFNGVSVTVQDCSFQNVGVHGICGRGTSVMQLRNVTMDHCQIRAVMVYQGASLTMEDCIITNTHDHTTPSIHVQGPELEEDKEKEETEQTIETPPRIAKVDENPTSRAETAQSKATASKGNDNMNRNKSNPIDYTKLVPKFIMKRCKVAESAGQSLVLEGQVNYKACDNEIE